MPKKAIYGNSSLFENKKEVNNIFPVQRKSAYEVKNSINLIRRHQLLKCNNIISAIKKLLISIILTNGLQKL